MTSSQYSFVSDDVDIESRPVKKIAAIQSSLPGTCLVGLQRFANRKLWQAYVARRDVAAGENSGDPNVELLFHMGSRICTGLTTNSEGFATAEAGSMALDLILQLVQRILSRFTHGTVMKMEHSHTLILAEVACGGEESRCTRSRKLVNHPRVASI